jgi:hypothetical protein
MFSSHRQKCEAIKILLTTVRLERLWTLGGPKREAFKYRDCDGRPLSSGERVMVLAAFDLWNGSGGLKFHEVPLTLDAAKAHKLLTLLLAISTGGDAVDQWIERERSLCTNTWHKHASKGRFTE